MLKLRSVNNIVIPPANTGSESKSKIAVMKIAQQNNGSLCIDIPGCRMLRIVVMTPKLLINIKIFHHNQ